MSACTVCGSDALSLVMALEGLPVLCNAFFGSAEEARAARRGRIELTACGKCGHLFNAAFDSQEVEYGQEYETSLHGSVIFRDYANRLARRLVEDHGLRNKEIIEVGCGQGEFLSILCSLGNNRGMGFDRAFKPPVQGGTPGSEVTILRELYGPEHAGLPVDFLCCRHVLEHYGRPTDFLSMVRETIGQRACAIYFEVPNGLSILRDAALWDILYEHPSLFWRGSLRRAFEDSGFDTDDIREEYGGQFLGLDGRSGDINGVEIEDPKELLRFAGDFRTRSEAKIDYWKIRLEEHAAAGKRIALWGAGSKGVTFLNLMEGAGAISFAVDVNPRKQGRFVPGSGQQIIPPEQLQSAGVDVVLVMNPIYLEEIKAEIARLALNAAVELP